MINVGLFILFLVGMIILLGGGFWVIMVMMDKIEYRNKRIIHPAPRPGDNISREEARRAVRKVIAQRRN